MDRAKFVANMRAVDKVMTQEEMRAYIENHTTEDDLPTCMGELNELAIELTRFQRGKMDTDDFLQELSHVQWAVWRLQDMFGVNDDTVRRAIQASFNR